MMGPPQKESLAPGDTGNEARDNFSTASVNQSLGNIKTLGACVSALISGWNQDRREDMPGRVDRAWLCEKPLELFWRDVENLGGCYWTLWLSNVSRVLVEDERLAEYLIVKLRDEGVLKTLPEIRVRGESNG